MSNVENKENKTNVPSIFNTREGNVRQRLAVASEAAREIVSSDGRVEIELLVSPDNSKDISLPLLPEYTEILPCLTIAIKEGDTWGRAAVNIAGKYTNDFHGGQGLIGATTDIINTPLFFDPSPDSKENDGDVTYSIHKKDAGIALQEFALSGATDFFKDLTGGDYLAELENRIVTNLGFQEIGPSSILRASVLIFLTGDEFGKLMTNVSANTQRLVSLKKVDPIKDYFASSVTSITPYVVSKEEVAFLDDVVERLGMVFEKAPEEVKEEVVVPM